MRIMGFWLELGVSGFRMDAVPFLIEHKGARVRHTRDYDLLHEMRDFLQWRCRDAIMLAEANVPPDESLEYFGAQGDRLQMMLNFWVNQRMFYALASGNVTELAEALRATQDRPPAAQWGMFTRSHDELDLGRLTDAHRQVVFDAFAPERGNASVWARHPPPARAHAEQRSPPARARLQPDVHAARNAGDAVRGRNRNGG